MAAPANDNIVNAQTLVPGTTQVTGSTVDSTAETGEFRTPGGAAAHRTVWFRWVAATSGSATITTVGSTFDTYLAVFAPKVDVPDSPAAAQLTWVASDDDSGGSSTSSVTFTAVAGRPYMVQVGGFDATHFGAYVLNYPSPATQTYPPADRLANAVVLAAGTTQYLGDNTDAFVDVGEQRGALNGTSTTDGFRTVWFRWTAPSLSSATITTVGSAFDTYLTVWQPKSGVTDPATVHADIEIVASNDDGGGGAVSSVTFTPVAGRTYYLQVSGFGATDFGAYTLNYPSPNDIAFKSGIAARNGTTSHTISFGYTPATGSLLVAVVYGAVTHAASGWTEQLSPVASGELSVFTRVAAGDTSITVTHNSSNYAVYWVVYEFPAGSTYTGGEGNNSSSDGTAMPTLSGLPGTSQIIIAARARVVGLVATTSGSTAWPSPWIEDVDVFDAWASGTDNGYMTVAHRTDYTGTSILPAPVTTYGGTWSTTDRQQVVFAIAPPSGGGSPATAALSAASGLSATAVRTVPGAAVALSAASGLSAAAVRTVPGATAALSAASGLSATAVRAVPALVALSAASGLSAAALRTATVATALSAATDLVVTGTVVGYPSVALSAASGLSATGVGTALRSAALSAASGLGATAVRAVSSGTALSAASGLSAATVRTVFGVAALSAASGLTSIAVRATYSGAALSAASGIAASGVAGTGLTMAAASGLSATSVRIRPGMAGLSAASDLYVVGLRIIHSGTSSLSAATSLSVTANFGEYAVVALSAASGLSATIQLVRPAAAGLSAATSLAATAEQNAAAALSAAGSMLITGPARHMNVAATLSAATFISAALAAQVGGAAASLTAAGVMTAAAVRLAPFVAAAHMITVRPLSGGIVRTDTPTGIRRFP